MVFLYPCLRRWSNLTMGNMFSTTNWWSSLVDPKSLNFTEMLKKNALKQNLAARGTHHRWVPGGNWAGNEAGYCKIRSKRTVKVSFVLSGRSKNMLIYTSKEDEFVCRPWQTKGTLKGTECMCLESSFCGFQSHFLFVSIVTYSLRQPPPFLWACHKSWNLNVVCSMALMAQ